MADNSARRIWTVAMSWIALVISTRLHLPRQHLQPRASLTDDQRVGHTLVRSSHFIRTINRLTERRKETVGGRTRQARLFDWRRSVQMDIMAWWLPVIAAWVHAMVKKPRESKTIVKDKIYTAQLCGVVLLNLLGFWNTATGALLKDNFLKAAREWDKALVTGVAGAITLLLVNVVGHTTKARLVFWRWNHPLPGTRVFSEYVRRDPRIDVAKLKAKVGTFPREPSKQNALWYGLYRAVESRPEVVHSHRAYLIYRDWACLSVVLFVFLVPASVVLFPSWTSRVIFASALVAQYLVARAAAVNCGKRFLLTVLALKAAEP